MRHVPAKEVPSAIDGEDAPPFREDFPAHQPYGISIAIIRGIRLPGAKMVDSSDTVPVDGSPSKSRRRAFDGSVAFTARTTRKMAGISNDAA